MRKTNTFSLDIIDICVCDGEIVGRLFCDDGFYAEAYITKQLKGIYGENLQSDFLKRVESKINLTIMKRKQEGIKTNIEILTGCGVCILNTPLEEIFEVTNLTPDGVKIGDKPYLLLNVTIFGIDYVNGKAFLKFPPIVENKRELSQVEYLNITNEVNYIYNDKQKKREFKKLIGLRKLSTKKEFVYYLSSYLQEMVAEIEYDEYYGFTLWTPLEYFLD